MVVAGVVVEETGRRSMQREMDIGRDTTEGVGAAAAATPPPLVAATAPPLVAAGAATAAAATAAAAADTHLVASLIMVGSIHDQLRDLVLLVVHTDPEVHWGEVQVLACREGGRQGGGLLVRFVSGRG